MTANDLIIKCFAKHTEGQWVAVCLDFCLAAQADTFEEAKSKLEAQIVFYVDEALQDKEFGPQLLQRKAPLSSWIEYYLIKLTHSLRCNIGKAFDETMPLRMA
jgi:predicted RNase H-like HicB family nuclease